MKQFPRPVIMVSSATGEGAEITFNALDAGAFDYVPKQLCANSLDLLQLRQDLVTKIQAAALWRVGRPIEPPLKKLAQSPVSECANQALVTPAIVVLGTSTGGPKALQQILPLLPSDLPVPILIVQHMPPGFTGPFAQRLNTLCSVTVREAAQHDLIRPGVIYIAPAGVHMTVDRTSDTRAFICLSNQPENCLHIPSVDITMTSVAEAYKNLAMGVILTGMGADGATGMLAIHREGGLTIGQNEASCTVYGMPRACAEAGALNRVCPLSQIPTQIVQATRQRKRA